MNYSNYEYIPREIEVEENILVDRKFIETSRFLIFYSWYYQDTYEKVKVKKTVYDKYKKIPKLDWLWFNLIPVKYEH